MKELEKLLSATEAFLALHERKKGVPEHEAKDKYHALKEAMASARRTLSGPAGLDKKSTPTIGTASSNGG